MRRVVIPLALAAVCLVGCQIGPDTTPIAVGGTSGPTSSSTTSDSPSTTPSATSTPTPTALATPDVRSNSTCSVATGKFPKMTKGVRFTAQSTLVNRGNIGASVQLKATWNGSSAVHRAQTISLGYDKKVKVTFNAPTTPTAVTAFRANGSGRCAVTVKVLAFVGKPRPAKK